MGRDPGLNEMRERELANLSFEEAPRIVSEMLPGPKSQKLIDIETENETVTRVIPNVMPAAWEQARGATVKDPDGNYYIDLTAGIAVNNVGHCHPQVVETINQQCKLLMHNPDAPNPSRARLGQKLQQLAPGKLKGNVKMAYGLSGSSAVEIAVKFARAATGKSHIVAFQGAYHGALGTTVSLTTSQQFRSNYGPFNPYVYHTGPYAYCYRCPFKLEYPKCELECAKYIENQLLGPSSGIDIENVAALIVEPVQGEGGYVPPPEGFLNALKEICEKADILYIDDEVQAGMGRTGKMFAIEHYGVTPDLITLGKALGGDLPFSAVLTENSVAEKLSPMSHILTAVGNATSSAVACTNIDLLQDGLLERAEKLGGYTRDMLQDMMNEIEMIGDVRGKGFMIAIELVKNRETKTPIDLGDLMQILWGLRENGVLMLPCGRHNNVLRFMPPLVITKKHVDRSLETIGAVLKQSQENILE